MDRENVIKGLESLRDVCNAKADMAIGEGRIAWAVYESVVHLAIDLLRKQEPVEPKSAVGGWISVKDRLPDALPGITSSAVMLVCYKAKCSITGDMFSHVTMSSFNTRCKEWYIQIYHEIVKVTHWMPLPEPPKEEPT